MIFDIVGQLDRGSGLIVSSDERNQLAELNWIAGKRAMASTAHHSALTYLVAGAALLQEDAWDRRRDLIFQLELHRAECEFLTGALAKSEERLADISQRASNALERAAVARLRINLYTAIDRPGQAISVCLDCLRQEGIDWSPHPTEEEVRREYERIWSQVGSRNIEELIDLPLMGDPGWQATMDVLTPLLPAALFSDQRLFSLVVARMANVSLEHGHTDGSCLAYVWLGLLLGPWPARSEFNGEARPEPLPGARAPRLLARRQSVDAARARRSGTCQARLRRGLRGRRSHIRGLQLLEHGLGVAGHGRSLFPRFNEKRRNSSHSCSSFVSA